jgi:hypothetical protein
MGLGTVYKQGSTPKRFFEARPLLWNHSLGCINLFEDAMLACPGHQLFCRGGDGFSYGGPLKKVQWILSIAITQIQIMLYPDENMANFTASEGSVSYPGQNLKLQHMSWLFETFLLVSKNAPTNKFGMSSDSEEAVAKVVVEAATNFAQTWFPANSSPIPTADLCVRLNNELPFTHAVFSKEERAGFGYSSGGTFGFDAYKIISNKVPVWLMGEGPS